MKQFLCLLAFLGLLAGCAPRVEAPEPHQEPSVEAPEEETGEETPEEPALGNPEAVMGEKEQQYYDTYLRTWGFANPFYRDFGAQDNPLEEENLYLMFHAMYLLEHGYEELEALNMSGDLGTEIYPAEVVEGTLTAHFNVTAAQLRETAGGQSRSHYDGEAGTYEFGTGYGGAGPIGAVTGYREEGDVLELDYGWFELGENGGAGEKGAGGVLTIRLLPERGWKYEANRVTQ